MIIEHCYTGVRADYVAWDGNMSWKDRFFHACPYCGGGVTSPIEGPPMAHRECMSEVDAMNQLSKLTDQLGLR